MDLFTITCTTCKSRLKVRDQAAIGQILACPKCGGMVMVKPPPAFHEAGEQRSDVPTATELSTPIGPKFDQTLDSSAFDVVDDLLSDAPPKTQPPPTAAPAPASQQAVPKPRFVGGPKTPRPHLPAPDAGAVPPPPPEPPKPAEPSPLAASSGRPWLLIALSVGLGIALAFAAVTATVLFLRGTSGPVRPGTAAAGYPRPKTAAPSAANPAPQSMADDAVAKSAAQPLTEAVEPPTESSPEGQAIVSAAPATDPIGIVEPPAVSQPATPPDPSGLAKFDNLLNSTGDDPLALPATAPPPGPAPADSGSTVAKPAAPRPPPLDVDVPKRLADPLVSIETAGTPLADFVQLVSDLSTIPITLELPLTPATVETPVVLKLGGTTVGTALEEALKPLRLESVIGEGQLVIRHIEPESFEPISRSVKDLTDGDETQLAELAELLRATVEPDAWRDEAGGSLETDAAKGSLIIKQRRAVQLQVLIALEKLRAARRPPLPHAWKLDPKFFEATTRSSRAAAALETSVSLNFSQPTRLVTILQRLGEATATRIVVDWRDIASAGWNPAAEAKLLVSGKPLSESLDALLDPLDLAWRVIDATTIQIVTPSRLLSQAEFELYPVAPLVARASGEALLERIRTAMAKALTEEAGGEVRYDEQSQCIVAWLPQPHQQVLELLLNQWAEAAAK